MMQKFAVAVAAALALAPFGASAAFAENQVSDAATVIDTLDVTTVGKMIAEIGGQKVETREEGDKKIITFSNDNTPFLVAVALCDIKPGKCVGMAQITVMESSTAIALDAFNTYNADNLFMTAFKLDGNKFGFGRVVIVDGGVTRQNLAINLAAFVVGVPDELKKLQGQVTSSLQPNAQVAASMAGVRFTPVQADPRHVRAISDQLLANYKTMLTRGIRH